MFGQLVERLRGSLSQKAFGDRINRRQTDVTRLEADYYQNPPSDLLRKIADTAAGIEARASSKRQRGELSDFHYARLVGALVCDNYGIGETRASLLTLDARSLQELAEWERQTGATKLWIVTPAFQDNRAPELLSAVAVLLAAGTQVEYFVPDHELDLHGGWPRLVARLREILAGKREWQSRLIAHGLRDEELRWLTSSVVIAHIASGSDHAIEGYLILDQDGRPALGVRMSHEDVYRRFAALTDWLRSSVTEIRTMLASEIIDPLSPLNAQPRK